MTSRVLPPAEWNRLDETDMPHAVWTQLNPTGAQVVVVEDEHRIVACWCLIIVRHVEAFWVHPTHRKRGGVLRRLFVTMRALLNELGATMVVTHAETPDVAALLCAAGATPLPGQAYLLPVDFGPWRKD